MGRRARKVTTAWDGSTWQSDETRFFVYDGWNLIEELNGSGTVTASYVHGLDLSQSIQGAGGIGGILARVDHGASKSHVYFYDANGNVGQLIDSSDGSIAAAYEYAPFGGLTSAMGTYAETNPFRFSSKYADDVAGLYYYGYRYYSPELGRWLSRDPIGEAGGINLYGFVGNDGVNGWDYLGQNEVVVSGGINTNLRDDNHDQNWKHFIIAAKLKIAKSISSLQDGEVIEWHVQRNSYQDRAINENIGMYDYINEIERIASEFGDKVVLRWYLRKMHFAKNINTNLSGKPREGKEKISTLKWTPQSTQKMAQFKIDFELPTNSLI